MHLTQYLIFEIGRECNLGGSHPQCPNTNPGRYSQLPHIQPLENEQIATIAGAFYKRHGFRGRVGFHYYNEPLIQQNRMWHLMDMIDRKTKNAASYVLWTNGTLLPKDCRQFKRFAEIHVTNYHLPAHPIRNLVALTSAQPATQVHTWRLDDRLHGIGGEVGYEPCRRMFTEFIIDYFGNVHLCCYDWQGLASIGTVHKDSLGLLVGRWKQVRQELSGSVMSPDAPDACLRCKMRSSGIPSFIPNIAREARRHKGEPCHA